MDDTDISAGGIQRAEIRSAVASILLGRGKTMEMIEAEHGRMYSGDGSQDEYRNSAVWHSKRNLDRMVVEKLNLDPDALLGPRRKSDDFRNHTTHVISTLRGRGAIQDWHAGRGLGVWRVTDPLLLHRYVADGERIAAKTRGVRTTIGSDPIDLNSLFLSIIDHGAKDNTYKFALARALLDYCRDHSDASDSALEIPYEYFADKFMRYYFYQEYKFRIRQNFRPGVPPRAIKILRDIFGPNAPGDFDALDRGKVEKARHRFLTLIFGHARRKTSLVIPRFQKVYRGSAFFGERMFYEYDDDAQLLTLKPGAFEFFRQNHPMLSKVVLVGWAKFLEKINPSLPMLVAKIERDEAKRGSLASYRNLYLRHWCHCFYCNSRLEREFIQVDHFIPWSYLFDDNAWNLVLACRDCNCKKSSALPAVAFRDELISRNGRYYDLMPKMKASLDQLNSGRGWEPEIIGQYERCAEYGFGTVSLP